MGEDVCREDASDISCCYSHTDKTQVPFIIMYRGFPRDADTCSALEI